MKVLQSMGIVPRTFLAFVKLFPSFRSDYKLFKQQLKQSHLKELWPLDKPYPILHDKYSEGGTMTGAYFHQDLLVAKKIYQKRPLRHVDIGSRTDGFVAHVSVFMPVELIDIRPLTSKVANISFVQGDLMNPISESLHNSTDSLSSLHAIEHFGLGRYGDPIDVNGYTKALDNIYQMIKSGGIFYFSVPMGQQRVEFNAQRVFSLNHLLFLFENKYKLLDFSFVDDAGDLHENINLTKEKIQTNCGCHYGCAIFELQKL